MSFLQQIGAGFDIYNDIVEPIRNLLWPPNVGNVLLIAMLIGGLTVFIFWLVRTRAPAEKRIDEYIFSTPEHYFRAMMYHYPDPTNEQNLELLKSLPEAVGVANLMLANKDNLYFYVGEIQKMSDATIEDGVIILMTHHQLDDRESYYPAGSHYDIFRGTIHLRRAKESLPQARFYENAGEWNGKTCHLVYYPMPPNDHLQQPTIISSPEVILGVASQIKVTVQVLKENDSYKKLAKAYKQDAYQARSDTVQSRKGESHALRKWSDKLYYQQELREMGSSLSTWVVLAVAGFSVAILPDILRPYQPTASQAQLNIEAIVAAAVIIWIISAFRRD